MKKKSAIARRVISLGLAAVMALSLAACGKKPSGEPEGATGQPTTAAVAASGE